ncbi:MULTISPECIES: hypothetical protein [unclassified Lysobacter]|uniref:hypothetical protein n=1 Tax=unclassified Lysobacter TaxID=2635362 RepID=UPI001C22E026|nr:hypothetical protein [Lysobacter sp. MMG2]MBU8977307.1 hypothetical protein [Lysobacter sp. MMG2]
METLTAAVLLAALAAGPTAPTPEAEKAASASTDRMDARAYDERSRFASTHPNELFRLYGSDAAAKGQWEAAMRHFVKSASYADKYSQHRISLLYWHGVGVQRDRALAYAWADLAAERMYPSFIVLREKMWLELSEDERARALREGAALYAQYGDDVAKPRQTRGIAKAKRNITGSHLGYVGFLTATAPVGNDMGGTDYFDLTPMFASWRWQPKKYWAVEDAIWQAGSVEVGPAAPARRDADD